MQTLTTTSKKTTLATVKSFIKKNRENLFINVKSSFDGMTDGVERLHGGFVKAAHESHNNEHNFTVAGAWFVGSSRDYFESYQDEQFIGIEVYNSCGTFILAIQK